MWINREISSILLRAAATRPAVVVTGSRQVGKSTLLQRMFPEHRYVSLDLPTDAEQAELAPLDFLARFPPPVIIDEVQYAPAIFRSIKVLIDKSRHLNGQFILTGSQNFTLMKDISESLAGRCEVLNIEGLNRQEIRQDSAPDWENLLFRGGYPELWARPDLDPFSYYRSLTATYLERDVRQIINVTSLRDFERFLRMCALRSGQMLNKSELARDVGIKSPTANAWISVLQTLGVVAILEPWFPNRSKSVVKTPKLYISDTGLLCYLLNIQNPGMITSQNNVGAIWETFVFSELRRQQINAAGSWELYYYRDREVEVDFLLRQGDEIELADAKWTQSPRLDDFGNIQRVATMLGNVKVTRKTVYCRVDQPLHLGEQRTATPPP